MALIIKDRVQETSTTSGTGTLTLAGAVTGYQSFGSAIGAGNTTYYGIYETQTNNWEVGVGTVGSGTLARTTVLASSNAGSLVSFGGGQLAVWGDMPAAKGLYTDYVGTVSGLSIGGNAATVTNGIYTTDTGTVTNTMLAGSIANSKLLNSSITINGTPTALGGSISVGTVTSVTGTAPVVSSGGSTPAISMAAANGTTNGYLTSTDWTTFNNKQPAGSYLTSVTADAPLSGSGTSGSHLVISQATTSTNGYLSSTDWNTFNGKAPSVTYTTNYIPYGQGTTTPNQSSGLQYDGTSLTSGNIIGTAGLYAKAAMSASYTDGLVADYLTGNGRISVGSADTLSFYNGGVANTLLGQFGTDKTFTAAQVSASNGIFINNKTIAASYSIPSGYAASSTGPVTISSGQTVTVPSGSRWVVL